MTPTAPCLNCDKRHTRCHAECAAYADYSRYCASRRARRKQYAEIKDGYYDNKRQIAKIQQDKSRR